MSKNCIAFAITDEDHLSVDELLLSTGGRERFFYFGWTWVEHGMVELQFAIVRSVSLRIQERMFAAEETIGQQKGLLSANADDGDAARSWGGGYGADGAHVRS